MSLGSKIPWTDGTFNPWWGCARVSPACRSCYADTWAIRVGETDLWHRGGRRRTFGEKHWQEPLRWNRLAEESGKPYLIFCASMADVFEDHPALPQERERLWELIDETPWLVWQLLTKRPENVLAMVPSAFFSTEPRVHWLIVGGESGAKARRMDPGWARSLLRQGQDAGAAVFMKQAGSALAGEWGCRDRKGEDPDEWPEDLRIRELPQVAGPA